MIRWLKDHALWILLLVVASLGFVLAIVLRDKDRMSFAQLSKELKLEKEVIDAQAAASKQSARLGHEVAAASIKERYEKAIQKMNESDKYLVEELSNDPEALVAHIIRISS